MPTTYAHYRLGETVRRQLPESIQRIIKGNEELLSTLYATGCKNAFVSIDVDLFYFLSSNTILDSTTKIWV